MIQLNVHISFISLRKLQKKTNNARLDMSNAFCNLRDGRSINAAQFSRLGI
jgi:hypothetical protein